MNERLRQIAIDCGLEDRAGVDVLSGYSIQEFAEAIVNHAVECVRDVVRDEKSSLEWEACSDVQARIREYFGVMND